jgi:diacylglycerol kinase (ATP)
LPKLLLLSNPRSGRGEASAVEEELRAEGAVVDTAAIGQVDTRAGIDADRLAVAGGDGSIGPAAAAAASARLPLAVIPVGTANDFARALGIPTELDRACRLAVHGDRTRPMELGRMGERPFVNAVSAGLPPAAALAARGWKRRLGPLAYVLGAAKAGLSATPIDCSVSCDGDELYSGEAWQVTVACTGAFGAGSSVGAEPNDGRLDAVVFEAGSRAALVRLAYGLRTGRIRSQSGVHDCRAASVRLGLAPGTKLNLDGEICEAGADELRVERSAFEVVVP